MNTASHAPRDSVPNSRNKKTALICQITKLSCYGYPPLIHYVKELLQNLSRAGYQLAVASSSPLAYIEEVTEHWEIGQYFTHLISGESVKNPKPAPDVFLKAAEKLGVFPEECIVVEDSENGCIACNGRLLRGCSLSYVNGISLSTGAYPRSVLIDVAPTIPFIFFF